MKIEAEITPYLDIENQTLRFDTLINGVVQQHLSETINFKEARIKTALIALGWKPPLDKTIKP